MSYSGAEVDNEPIFTTNSPLISFNNWFYVFNSALMVDQFYEPQDSSLVESIKLEFKNLFFTNSGRFFINMLNYLVGLINFGSPEIGLLINHLSFYLTRLVDLAMTKFPESTCLLGSLNSFAQHLIQHFIGLKLVDFK